MLGNDMLGVAGAAAWWWRVAAPRKQAKKEGKAERDEREDRTGVGCEGEEYGVAFYRKSIHPPLKES